MMSRSSLRQSTGCPDIVSLRVNILPKYTVTDSWSEDFEDGFDVDVDGWFAETQHQDGLLDSVKTRTKQLVFGCAEGCQYFDCKHLENNAWSTTNGVDKDGLATGSYYDEEVSWVYSPRI